MNDKNLNLKNFLTEYNEYNKTFEELVLLKEKLEKCEANDEDEYAIVQENLIILNNFLNLYLKNILKTAKILDKKEELLEQNLFEIEISKLIKNIDVEKIKIELKKIKEN